MSLEKISYVFPEEYEELLQKRTSIEDSIKEQGRIIGEVTTQSSETRHDNAGFDEAKRVLHVLSLQFKEINDKISNTKILLKDTINQGNGGIVTMGSKVTINTGGKKGTYEIGGLTGPGKMSYQSPLAKAIMGKKTGDIAQFSVGNNTVTVSILDIS